MIRRLLTVICIIGAFGASRSAHAVCPGEHGAGSAAAIHDAQLDSLLLAAGFPQESLSTMRCIAAKESGSHPEAYCRSAEDHSKVLAWGLFQIYRMWFKECSGSDDEESQLRTLANPAQNVKCARRVYLSSKAQTGNPYRQWDVYEHDGACHGLDPRYP